MINDQPSISKMLFEPIFVPVEGDEGGDISFLKFPLEEAALVVGFSTILKLAKFCGEQTNYIETSASELFGQLIPAKLWFGFDFEGEEGDIYDTEGLREFLVHLDRDIEARSSQAVSFQAAKVSEMFQNGLTNLLSEFDRPVIIGVVEDEMGQLILAVEKEDLQKEYSLLAKIHRFISSDEERAEISILPCESFAKLGELFNQCAAWVKAPEQLPVEPKVPNLRY